MIQCFRIFMERYGNAPVLSPCTEADDPSVGWDYRSVGYPTVIQDAGGIWHMWFCGGPNTNHGIGYAWSNDGINWTKDDSNPIFHKDDGAGWRDGRTYTPVVIGDQMWFSGKDTGVYAIGYATPACTPVFIVTMTEGPLLVPVDTPVLFEAMIADGCGQVDAVWSFGDDSPELLQYGVANPVEATHTYASPGIYTVVLTVSDEVSGPVADLEATDVVVYDPTGGFVTGGGTIWSEAEPDAEFMLEAGEASFGFVAKYKKGKNVPDGSTNFVFEAGALHFHSSDYDWLVVAGNTAKFKGTGTIDGLGDGYKFMLWAGDNDPDVDTFRILIWEGTEEDPVALMYDNGPNDPITGGSIIIHKEKAKK